MMLEVEAMDGWCRLQCPSAGKHHTHTRWLQIKRVMKLNNNQSSPKLGEEGYNPAFKFDMLYDVLISNLNAVTRYAESDQCGDETTWGHGCYGKAGSGLAGRIMGKPSISRRADCRD
jgi:hypothetical protein